MLKCQYTSSPRLLTLLAVLFTSACATPPSRQEAPVELPESFSRTGEASAATSATDRWWQGFDDPALNGLIALALDDNLTLKASYQRLIQARAVADRQRAGLFPSLNGTAGAERRESDTSDSTRYSAGLSASYEIDLWGRVQALGDAEELRAAASLADHQAAAVSLTGEITNTWFQLVAQRAQRELAKTQLQTNLDVLSLIESRFSSGQSGSADVLRQRQLVSASRERLHTVEAELSTLQNQLSVLLGRAPGVGNLPTGDILPTLPPLPPTGVPAELVQRRPDLRQAWQLVRAADKDLAVAISNRFPRISIDASVSSQAPDASDLFDNWLATLAGNLVVPLIDGGQRRADVRRSHSVREQRLFEYGQAVLTAIQEVEDALIREQQQRRRLDQLENQIRLADATYRQLRTQYFNGTVSYIEVLNTLQSRQDLRRTILSAQQQLLSYRVALYRALAGSPDNLADETQVIKTENDQA